MPVARAVILDPVECKVVTACFLHVRATVTPLSKCIIDVTDRLSRCIEHDPHQQYEEGQYQARKINIMQTLFPNEFPMISCSMDDEGKVLANYDESRDTACYGEYLQRSRRWYQPSKRQSTKWHIQYRSV
jgi:hypothetical protein